MVANKPPITMQEVVSKYTLGWHDLCSRRSTASWFGLYGEFFFREMVRQGRKNINCISNCNTHGTNLLAAVGGIARMEVGFPGLEVYGFANGLRRALESGQTVLEDYSNGGIPVF